MSDYDDDLILAAQRDGILDAAGGHRREPVWEREGRDVECLPCGDQGCDYCNTPPDPTAPPPSTLHRTWRDEVGVWEAYEAAREELTRLGKWTVEDHDDRP